jgi:hypothetical protein
MPQLILWALGAVGAAVVAKWLLKEARRVNADLDAARTAPVAEAGSDPRNLERDPQTGIYRPKS